MTIDTKAMREKVHITSAEQSALCDALEAARAEHPISWEELNADRQKAWEEYFSMRIERDSARAVMAEEAARLMEPTVSMDEDRSPTGQWAAERIRALAPLDPGLVVLSKEAVAQAVAVLRAVARRSHRVALHSSGCDIHPRELPADRFSYDNSEPPRYTAAGRCSCGWGAEAADLNSALAALEKEVKP